MFFPVDYNNTSNDDLFEKNHVSIKKKGAKISLQNRKLAMSQFLARVSDLGDLPRQMSNLFSGNSSRLQHLLFDDVASSFDGTSPAKDFIINSMKSKSVDKRKQDRSLTLEQVENFLINFHKYAFNIKLGMENFNTTTSEVELEMNSLELINVTSI
jgi:hypothetical protein